MLVFLSSSLVSSALISLQLFKSKKDERPSSMTVGTTGSQSQFKVVADKRQSLLVNEGHPAGWVNRTQEKSHLAAAGDDWRSDA